MTTMNKKLHVSFLLMLALILCVATCRAAGTRKTTNYSLSGFTSISASGSVHVVVMQGPVTCVRLEESPNPDVVTIVDQQGSRLKVYTKILKKKVRMKSGEEPIAYVTLPHLTAIEASGAVHMKLDNMKTHDLSITLSGASNMQGEDLKSDNLRINCSGASAMAMGRMECQKLHATCTGASKMNGQLHGNEAKIENSGASKVEMSVNTRQLELINSGASKSDITFKGRRLSARNTGAGKVDLDVDCEELTAQNSGAAKFTICGTADQTNIDASGASKINTSRLNKF